MPQGLVKFFWIDKGYGFIAPDDRGKDERKAGQIADDFLDSELDSDTGLSGYRIT